MRVLDALVAALTAAMVAATVVITCTAVFFRYVMNAALPWPEEIAGYLLVWISFLGAYLALRREGHISFDMLLEKLPITGQVALRTVIDVMLIGFFAVVFWQSIRLIRVVGSTEIETATIAQGWFMLVLPFASAIIILALLADMLRRYRGAARGVG